MGEGKMKIIYVNALLDINKKNKMSNSVTIPEPVTTVEEATEKAQAALLKELNEHLLNEEIKNTYKYWDVLRDFILTFEHEFMLKMYVECLPENLLFETTSALLVYSEVFESITSENMAERGMTLTNYLDYKDRVAKATFIMDKYLFSEMGRRYNYNETFIHEKMLECVGKLHQDNSVTKAFTI